MIKFENTVVSGWEAAIRGCRNPMNSWDKGDTEYYVPNEYCSTYVDCDLCPLHDDPQACDRQTLYELRIGPNDMKMMTRLIKAGTDEAKFMRYIDVTVDITAPLYWWKEFDTYKVGTVANSCSTMHKIHDKEFTMDDFSHEHLLPEYMDVLQNTINELNDARWSFVNYEEIKNSVQPNLLVSKKDIWWQMIQLLPSSYNQRRTVKLNYQVLRAMYFARRNHKLDEWREGFCEWVEGLPYSELITMNGKYEDLVEKFAELKVENTSLKECNKTLNEEVDRLRDMLAELDYENRNLKNHLSEMYHECILKGADKEFGDI